MKIGHLIATLETSVKHNGPDFPLTLGHLLNIVKLMQRQENKQKKREAKQEEELRKQLEEILHDPYGDS